MPDKHDSLELVANKLERVLIYGDLSRLSFEEQHNYNKLVCDSVGLNWLTRPLEFIKLNGRLVLYAKKDATDQLRKLYAISIVIRSRELQGDIYVVTAQASTPVGRTDESTGAVSVKGLQGDALANAYMKAETKAKRRATLSICGLGLLDETELETIKDVSPHKMPPPQSQLPEPGLFDEQCPVIGDDLSQPINRDQWTALKDFATYHNVNHNQLVKQLLPHRGTQAGTITQEEFIMLWTRIREGK